MSDLNAKHNRLVWFDVPVADLERASTFYSAVLRIDVHREESDGFAFAVLAHEDGNGGCLVPNEKEISATAGILCYMNTDGRIRDAVAKVSEHGGEVVQPVHAIGPHGFRAIVHDSEGNRLALHSNTDA